MYQTVSTNSFSKDTKRFKNDKAIRELYKNAVQTIVDNPEIGTQYTSNLYPYFKYEIGEKPQFRLMYTLYECNDYCRKEDNCKHDDITFSEECQGLIEFHFFKTREECNNFYARDREYFQERLRK